jgi:heme-degrading monooxygenase HmoA
MVTLHITLDVRPGEGPALEALYREAYVPAITKQGGFRSTTLLRSAAETHRYEIDIVFDSEAQRVAWAGGPDHDATWPRVVALCTDFSAHGFEILA